MKENTIVKASVKNIKGSPRKIMIITKAIAKMRALDALNVLQFSVLTLVLIVVVASLILYLNINSSKLTFYIFTR